MASPPDILSGLLAPIHDPKISQRNEANCGHGRRILTRGNTVQLLLRRMQSTMRRDRIQSRLRRHRPTTVCVLAKSNDGRISPRAEMETAIIYIIGRVSTSELSVCDLICPTQNSARSTRYLSFYPPVPGASCLVFRVPVSLVWMNISFLSQSRTRAGAGI